MRVTKPLALNARDKVARLTQHCDTRYAVLASDIVDNSHTTQLSLKLYLFANTYTTTKRAEKGFRVFSEVAMKCRPRFSCRGRDKRSCTAQTDAQKTPEEAPKCQANCARQRMREH